MNGLVMSISHCVKVNINISLHSLKFFLTVSLKYYFFILDLTIT